ncbi:MAG: ATP phosphoribosyltransferase [Bacteroidetes bacterium]|nr:MAG: ATP phosphoribosyltransferase [Bacteroidota bacterium]
MNTTTQTVTDLKLGLPKGRMSEGVLSLLKGAGISISFRGREYRPEISLPDTTVKVFKPQNVIEMLSHGRRDVGFAGADWVTELQADLVEVLDTGLDPVRLVVAAPVGFNFLKNGSAAPVVVVSEYERITRNWIGQSGLNAEFIRSYGATEVFPPDDADVIVDNVATGSTLKANGLEIIDTIMTSSTRLYASPAAMDNPSTRPRIEDLAMVLKSVLDARRRVMLEINADASSLDAVVAILPSMREATVSPLFRNSGFSVRAAVPRAQLPALLPKLKLAGGTDIVVTSPDQIVA